MLPPHPVPPSRRLRKSMSMEASDVGENNVVSIPRGGPIYVPDMVSPLIRVPDFELSVFNELQNLNAEVCGDVLETCDEDISVDELKILKEEELVEKAFQEAFKDGELTTNDQRFCLGGSWSIKDCASSSSERIDRRRSLKSTSSSAKVKSLNIHEHIAVHFPEVILCFEVYHSRKAGVKTQEFLVLGRQFLTEVRDKIYCLTDEIMKKSGQYDPSGYFLIEDVFCNDTRDASAIDYSKSIIEWLENSKNEALEKWECIVSGEMQQKQKAILDNATELKLPQFKSVEMQKSRFCDLRFRLGAGYIYCHQGDCKHLIVIREMRLIHPEDIQNRAAYPLNTFQSKQRFRKCSVCKIYKAEKVTVDDKWAAENPCYFCNLCYYMLHYVNGSLLYNEFSVYDYYHE